MTQTLNFSLIIPTFLQNTADQNNLVRLLNSIPKRNDLEILLCNDGSPYPLPPLDIDTTLRIYAQQNKGAGAARNLGLEHAQGTWIFFADADDYFDTDALTIIMDSIIKNTHDVVYTYTLPDPQHPDQNRARDPNQTLTFHQNNQERGHLLEHYLPTCKFIKQKYLAQNTIRFGETSVANDLLFSVSLVLEGATTEILQQGAYVLTYRPGSLDTQHSLNAMQTRILVKHEANKRITQKAKNQHWLRRRTKLIVPLFTLFKTYPIQSIPFIFRLFLNKPHLGIITLIKAHTRRNLP